MNQHFFLPEKEGIKFHHAYLQRVDWLTSAVIVWISTSARRVLHLDTTCWRGSSWRAINAILEKAQKRKWWITFNNWMIHNSRPCLILAGILSGQLCSDTSGSSNNYNALSCRTIIIVVVRTTQLQRRAYETFPKYILFKRSSLFLVLLKKFPKHRIRPNMFQLHYKCVSNKHQYWSPKCWIYFSRVTLRFSTNSLEAWHHWEFCKWEYERIQHDVPFW